jgi:hypothetical protein
MGSLFHLLLASSFIGNLNAQIINIESKRFQNDTVRFKGQLNFSGSYNQNDTTWVANLSSSLLLQFRTKKRKDTFILFGGYDLAATNRRLLNNSGFGHVRHIHKFKQSWLRLETFLQAQNNVLLKIKFRGLAGSGLRFRLFNKEKLKLNLGTSVMYDAEIDYGEQFEQIPRGNAYLSFNYASDNSAIEIIVVNYYQPNLLKPGKDFRFNTQASLIIRAGKKLEIPLNTQFLYDSSPPQGVRKQSINGSLGITWKF